MRSPPAGGRYFNLPLVSKSRITAADISRLSPCLQRQVELQLNPISKDYHASSDQDRREASNTKPEQALRDEPVGTPSRETLYTSRVLIRITSYRRRLLDPDNLCGKWFLDACRYSRLVRNDRPQDIELEVSQEKVRSRRNERTEIVIEPLRKEGGAEAGMSTGLLGSR